MGSGSQETIQVGALSVRFLVEATDSNGSVSVFECFVPADSRMPAPHSHDAFEETIYGLEGIAESCAAHRSAAGATRDSGGGPVGGWVPGNGAQALSVEF